MAKRLYDDCFLELKIITLHLLEKTFGCSFKFYSNLSFNKSNLKKLLPFYREMVISWSQYLSTSPETLSLVSSQFLWYNNHIKIEDVVIHIEKFSKKNVNFLLQLFENDRSISWANLQGRYELKNDIILFSGFNKTCNFRKVENANF